MIGLYIFLGFVIIVIVPHLVMSFVIFMKFYFHKKYEKTEEDFFNNKDYEKYYNLINNERNKLEEKESKEVKIKSFDGLDLYADYYQNIGDKIVLLVHGLKTPANINFAYIANKFFAKGYSLLIIDQRCHHRSGGKFISYGYKESKDVINWVNFIKNELNYKHIVAYGISMGAASIALASPELDIDYIVLDSCYNSIGGLILHLCPKNVFFRTMVLPIISLYAVIFAKVRNKDVDISKKIEENKNPVLFIHGDIDYITPLQFLEENYEHNQSKKDIMVIALAPHSMPLLEGGDKAVQRMFEFIEK